MITKLQAAIEALPRYRDNAAGTSLDPRGPYLWRADVLAALQAAPAQGSIDTALAEELKVAPFHLTPHTAYAVAAHIAQRAVSGDATDWKSLYENEKAIIHDTLMPRLRAAEALATPAPIADEVAGDTVAWLITLPGGELELSAVYFDKDEADDYIENRAIEGCYLTELIVRPPAPPASAPDAPAGDLPPLPEPRPYGYIMKTEYLFTADQMRAHYQLGVQRGAELTATLMREAAAAPALLAEPVAGNYCRTCDMAVVSNCGASDCDVVSVAAPVAAEPAPVGPLYTCIGKGGTYELLGTAFGAGRWRNTECRVYRDTVTKRLYFRDINDFEKRMESIP